MAYEKEVQICQDLANKFIPIIMDDEDIIHFFKKNNLEEEDVKTMAFWFACAATSLFIAAQQNEDLNKLQEVADFNCKEYEKQLTQRFGDVHDILIQVLKENFKEWLDIIADQLRKSGIEERENDETIENHHSSKDLLINIEHLLGTIVVREDDAIEFIEKYADKVDKNLLLHFICIVIMYTWLQQVKDGSFELSEADAAHLDIDEMLNIVVGLLKHATDEVSKSVPDFEQFSAELTEVRDDHYREFVKKMFKKIASGK